mmetsp:Transcript_63064/g.150287  ORF Transcript_63064/g.150287 Transcript_63064/m.150287 type:complete len:649 (+) Transcript_63064:103-2049(+)
MEARGLNFGVRCVFIVSGLLLSVCSILLVCIESSNLGSIGIPDPFRLVPEQREVFVWNPLEQIVISDNAGEAEEDVLDEESMLCNLRLQEDEAEDEIEKWRTLHRRRRTRKSKGRQLQEVEHADDRALPEQERVPPAAKPAENQTTAGTVGKSAASRAVVCSADSGLVLCPPGGATMFQKCEWCGPAYKVFIFDHRNLVDFIPNWILGNTSKPSHWLHMYQFWSEHPMEVLKEADPDYPDPFVSRDMRTVIAERFPRLSIVDEPSEAQLVFWMVWDYALCLANGTRIEKWSIGKRRFKHSCPLHWTLWKWLQTTPRWERNGGRDYIIMMADPDGIEQRQDPPKSSTLEEFWPAWKQKLHSYIAGVTRVAILVVVEDRRFFANRGHSCSIAVPYYSKVSGAWTPNQDADRKTLISFTGSVAELHHTCDHCLNGIHPRDLRAQMVRLLEQRCFSNECHVRVLDEHGLDRNNPLAVAKLNIDGEGVQTILRKARFCPIPRGDSGATKRFYSSILAGCIPVVISDHLPRPFSRLIDYNSFMLALQEEDFMAMTEDKDVTLLEYLRSVSEQDIARLQLGLRQARNSLVYSRGCSLPWACNGTFERSSRRRQCPYSQTSPSDALDHLVLTVLEAHYQRASVPKLLGNQTNGCES